MMEVSVPAEIAAARARLRERLGDRSQQIGGKGTARRKLKKVHKSTGGDDKKLQAFLKRINASTIPAIEEVRMVKDDGKSLVFTNPKVHAALSHNTYMISGQCEERDCGGIAPQMLQQMSQGGVQITPNMIREFQSRIENTRSEKKIPNKGDDDVPDLVENFEDISKQ